MGTYQTMILAEPHLAGYWQFAEASGTVAIDSALGNNGAYVNAFTLAIPGIPCGHGATGLKLSPTGGQGQVQIPYNAVFDFAGDCTFESWHDFTDGSGNAWCHDITFNTVNGFNCWFSGTSTMLWDILGNRYQNPMSPTATGWNHFAWVLSGTTVLLYCNGVNVLTQSGVTHPGSQTAPLVCGRSASVGGSGLHYAHGAVYSVALSPAKVLQHYKVGHCDQAAPSTNVFDAFLVDGVGPSSHR